MVDASRGQVAQSILKALTDGRKRDVNVQHSVQHKLLLKRSSLVQRARVAYTRGPEGRRNHANVLNCDTIQKPRLVSKLAQLQLHQVVDKLIK